MSYKTTIEKWNHLSILKIEQDSPQIYIDDDMRDFINKSNLNGRNVVDGGSNIGFMSLLFSEAVGENGLVYSFELQRIIYQVGCANAALNGKTNIISFNMALSDESNEMVGFSTIDYSGENISSTGIRTEIAFGTIDYYDRIKTIALDDLNIPNVGLIKLDLEGYEPQALKGMWSTVDRCRPNMVIELSPGYLGDSVHADIISQIKDHNYSVKEGSSYNYFCEPN
jgi:FkbM family methyltransferase